MQNLVRSKTIGVTGNGQRGKAGAGPGRDLLYGKEGPYQDRPLMCPFCLSSPADLLLISDCIPQNPGSKIQKYRKYNPPSTLNSNQIPQIQQ